MSGTRFTRTGRCRFIVCLFLLVLLVCMVAIFHSSQVHVDEIRKQRLHCEHQQEALNERLTILVEQKYHLEKNQERERVEQLETKRDLEQKVKELEVHFQKQHLEQQMQYDKLKQTHMLLQSDYKHLKEETQKTNKRQMQNIDGLESKLQSVRSELQTEKFNNSRELTECKGNYNITANENKRLSVRIKELEQIVKDYHLHCQHKAMVSSGNSGDQKLNKFMSEKSFLRQDSVSEGVYHISLNISNNEEMKTLNVNASEMTRNGDLLNAQVGVTDKLALQQTTRTSLSLRKPFDSNNDNKPLFPKNVNGSLILNSVENFQLVPKSINSITDDQQQKYGNDINQVSPLNTPKSKSELPSKAILHSKQQIKTLSRKSNYSINVESATGSTTSNNNSSPLVFAANQRKLPENVAPIPENFEILLQKSSNENFRSKHNPQDPHLEPDFNKKKSSNYDSAAHEIRDVMAEDNSINVQHDGDINNFFNNPKDLKEYNKISHKDINEDKDEDGGNDDENDGVGGDNYGGPAAGDIAVKHSQQQHLLDDSLRNEVADDQGKEFGDGLRLDEGAMEEDDDDDYSNPSARKQAGGQAIRN